MAKRFSKIAILLMLVLALLVPMMVMSVGAEDTEIVFELGENGSASHSDGSGSSTYTETVGEYTLEITGGTNMYTGARDATGNSCIKFGTSTSSKTGSFTFTVPDGVNKVKLAVAKYKDKTTEITVNSTSYTLTNSSNDGAYDEIVVDTTTNKTVTFATVSGSQRAMLNTITFVVSGGESSCEHNYTVTATQDATCTEKGSNTLVCSKCGDEKTEDIAAKGHNYGEFDEKSAASCTATGTKVATCSVCGDEKEEVIPALGHNYVDGVCGTCGAEEPSTSTVTITFDSTDKRTTYSTSVQIWEENGITVTNNKANSTSNVGNYCDPARFYKSSEVVIVYPQMTSIVLECASGYVWGGDSNSTTNGTTVTITLSAPNDSYTLAMDKQVRVSKITITYLKSSECEHATTETKTTPATCTEAGSNDVVCSDCGHLVSSDTIPALDHSWDEGTVSSAATCTQNGVMTYKCTRSNCEATDEQTILAGHNYVNGICAKCFEKESLSGDVTLSFESTDYRVSINTEKQVWAVNGFTFTNNKASGSNIVDYSNPIRLYQNSEIVIEHESMTKIVFNCNTAAYATSLANSIVDNGTVNLDGKVVTVELNAPADSFTITLSVGQIRLDSITVYYGSEELDDAIVGASLYIGKDLSMLYNVTTAGDIADYTMKFTFNGEEIVVNATQFGDNYFFVLDAIAPNLMGENIKAELYCGDECVAVKEAYSVLEYCEYFLKGEGSAKCSAELKELLANLLEYGAAAQIYTDTNTENLVNKDVDGAVNYECTENVKDVSGSMAVIAGAGASFGVDNKLYFRLVEDYKSLGEVTAKINGEDAEIVGGYVYTEGVKATELSKVFTLVLYVDGTEVQTATYSITSYITIIGANDTAGAALANALYNYGCSAKNYVGE